jgi:hypothetical protein
LVQLRVAKYLVLRGQRSHQGKFHCLDARNRCVAEYSDDVRASRVLVRSAHFSTVKICIPGNQLGTITSNQRKFSMFLPSRDSEVLSSPVVTGPLQIIERGVQFWPLSHCQLGHTEGWVAGIAGPDV